MSEPTVPTPPAGYDPRPTAGAYPTNDPYSAPRSASATPVFQQVYIEKAPEQLEGEKLAKTSTIFGIVSLFFAGIIFGPLAIIKAAKAEKLGVDSTVGQVTGWIGAIMGALQVIVAIIYVIFFAAIFASYAESGADDSFNKGFSNTQEFGNNGSSEGSSFEELSPADRELLEKSLTQIAVDAAKEIN